ncbi:dethiobiotin synthase [Gangjinia marincola]|uniref:ATP-dependent dethiobiotin synthetase BioD n=1 Tax=Gangjinia marincola TaxID=578463 RepID=A0ABP3XVZ5_9FLAO
MTKHTFFITGISTDVGKTLVSAIITEALQADYFKPVQAGDIEHGDKEHVEKLISNAKTTIHSNAFELQTPMSPHAAATIDGIALSVNDINRPKTNNHLVVEGAGGLLVPLNETETITDLIKPTDNVIIVSRHYLGSINHTLLTVEALKQRKLTVRGIIFSGNEHPTTEHIIKKMTGLPIIGRVDDEPYVDSHVVLEYAERWRKNLQKLSS